MDGVRWEYRGHSKWRPYGEKGIFGCNPFRSQHSALGLEQNVYSWILNLLEPKRPLLESLKVSSQEGIISKPCFREIKLPVVYMR